MKMVRIGVSACLLGRPVRYDGGHRYCSALAEGLSEHFEFVPVCPEVEIGLGVPRKTMHLEGDPERPELIITETGGNLTTAMLTWCEKRLHELESECLRGFVFKSRSPSCGPEGPAGSGLFAAALIRRFPLMPTTDERRMEDPQLRKRFKDAVLAYDSGQT